MRKFIPILFLTTLLSACSTTVNIRTNPPGAEITMSKGDKLVSLGKSPLSIKESEITKKFGADFSSLGYYKLTASNAEGEVSESVLVPVGAWGRRSTTIVIPMNSATAAVSPDKVLRHIVNAQKFAETKQLLKSHDELDEALKLSPNFSYAMSMKGALYYANGEFNRSKEWYSKALRADPGNSEALLMLQDIEKEGK